MGILDFKRVPDKALPERLSEGELNATILDLGNANFDRVYKPETYGAVGDGITDDSAAIQAAINAAQGSFGQGGGRVVFSGKTYATATKLTLPATIPVKLSMVSGGSIRATAAMTAVLEKPLGACSGIVLEQMNIDGASLADAALDVLQANRFQVMGGQFMNGKVATVDFGRTGAQVYETEWLGGKVIGRNNTAGKTAADRPPYAFRTGTGCTDNTYSKFTVKNALTLVQERGQGNSWERVHPYGYPYKTTSNLDDWNAGTIQFDILGYSNQFVQCVVDSPEIGFRMAGGLNVIIAPVVLWPGDSRPTNPCIGIDIVAPGNSVIGGLFNNPGGLNAPATGVRIAANAWRASVVDCQFQGIFLNDQPIVNLGAVDGELRGNFSDTATMLNTTKNRIGNVLDVARGDGNEDIFRWGTGKANPGRMIAVGTGATGYLRWEALTAGAGFMIGATGNKIGFCGKVPVAPSTLAYARNTESASGAALRTALSSVGLATDSTVAATPPASAYFYPLSPGSSSTNAALGNDVLRLAPALLPAVTIARLGTEITVAGSAGSTVRIGIYADNGSWGVGSLVLDAGTIPGDVVGVAEVTLGSPVSLPAGYYWIGAVVQGSPATQPTLRVLGGNNLPPGFILSAGSTLPITAHTINGVGQIGVSGALPATLASPGGSGPAPVRLFMKIAS